MDDIREKIYTIIHAEPVMLFMKGTPQAPMCGFSKIVVDILQHYNVPFGFFNILDDEDVRQGIKIYSDWPTFPQVYIRGELIGGCDIIKSLHASGALASLIHDAS